MFDKIKQIFNKKEVQYIQSYGFDKPFWTTQKDEQYIKEAFNKLVWVYSCVTIIASCVSSINWNLYRKVNKNIIEIEEHPILNMLNKQANKNMTSKDFFELWATYLALNGKFFAEYNNPKLPTELYLLYPYFVQPVPNKNDFVKSFIYNIDNKKMTYDKELIMWSKFNDPLSLYDGLSPIKALARTIDTENEAVSWNKTTLQNSAVPPGALSVVNPSPELTERLRSEWLKRYSGSNNARIPLVLNAEKVSYVNFGLSAIDMDFLNQRKLNRVEICSAFGVPSQVVGDPEGQTYANYEEALKAFWQNTIIPRYLDKIKNDINANICSKYADNLYVNYNLDNVTALHESQDSLAQRTINLFEKNIISRNEARELIGFEKIDTNNLFFTDLSKNQNVNTDTNVIKNNLIELQKKNDNLIEESIEFKEWKRLDKEREKYIKLLESQFKYNFEIERKNIKKIVKRTLNLNIIKKTIAKTSKQKQNILKNEYKKVINEYASDSFNKIAEMKEIKQNDFITEEILLYIEQITGEKVVLIDDTTLNQIKKIIDESISTLSIEDIALKIDELYLEQIIPNRSKVIAQTETISASNYGSVAGAKKAQDEFNIEVLKKWLPTFDTRTRDTHRAMLDYKPIELNEKFKVGSSLLSFPADFSGDASEVINCRCAITYVRKNRGG